MRALKRLTFEAFRDLRAKTFEEIADKGDPPRITWHLPAVLMSAFALCFFQHPSLLEYQRRMKKRRGRSNLARVLGIDELPSDTQMRESLDGAPTEPLRRMLPKTFAQMRRVGWTGKCATEVAGEKYYTVAVDGSEDCHATKIPWPGGLGPQRAKGETHYSPLVVAATLTRAGSHELLPLDAEEVRKDDGQPQQDGALTAAKRLVRRLRTGSIGN